jgi:hypothetical protein
MLPIDDFFTQVSQRLVGLEEAAMSMRSFAQKWLGLSSRIALLFGVGALSAAGVKAEAAPIDDGKHPGVPQQSTGNSNEMRIWSDGGRIYLSEAGGAARELQLGDTPQARRLSQLLQQEGAVAGSPKVFPHGILLAGGGGSGFQWSPPRQTANSAEPAAAPGRTSAKPGTSAQAVTPDAPKTPVSVPALRGSKD